MSGANEDNLRRLVRHFRVLRGWTVRMVDDPDNHGCSWGGRRSNRFSIGTWDCKAGQQPSDYILHEVLHAAVISVVRMDKRKPKEQRQAEEKLVQDLCSLIIPNPKGEPPAPEGRVGLDPLDVPRSAARQDGGAPFGMLPTRSVGNIAGRQP